jgi:hypothetical protein
MQSSASSCYSLSATREPRTRPIIRLIIDNGGVTGIKYGLLGTLIAVAALAQERDNPDRAQLDEQEPERKRVGSRNLRLCEVWLVRSTQNHHELGPPGPANETGTANRGRLFTL